MLSLVYISRARLPRQSRKEGSLGSTSGIESASEALTRWGPNIRLTAGCTSPLPPLYRWHGKALLRFCSFSRQDGGIHVGMKEYINSAILPQHVCPWRVELAAYTALAHLKVLVASTDKRGSEWKGSEKKNSNEQGWSRRGLRFHGGFLRFLHSVDGTEPT